MKRATLKKPVIDTAEVLGFATGATKAGSAGKGRTRGKKAAQTGSRPLSGLVPEGDARIVANIKEELHLKLKIAAANRRTTMGAIIEELLAKHL